MTPATGPPPAEDSGRTRALAWPFLLAALALLAFGLLGSRGLGEPDEGRYVEAASEMAESGSWLLPTIHGAPHLTKPPLTYWLIAAGLGIARDEWGARAFLGVSFAATAGLVALLGGALLGRPSGRVAGLVYATSFLPFAGASVITTDTLLTLWETAAIAAWWWSLGAASDTHGRRRSILAWLLLGLAFMTKGPPGLLPLAILATYVALSPREGRRESWRRLLNPAGIGVFMLTALPWYALIVAMQPGLFEYFIDKEVVGRTVSGVHGRNSEWWRAFSVYVPALLLGALPWCVLWPRLLWRAREWRRPRDPRRLLLWLWILVPVAIFAVASSRLSLYVLPVFPAIALLTTLALFETNPAGSGAAHDGRRLRAVIAVAALSGIALLGLRAVSTRVAPHRDSRAIARLVEPLLESGDTVVAVVGRPLHSLDFYMGRHTLEIRLGQRPETAFWPGREPREALDTLLANASPLALLVSDAARPDVERAIERARRRFTAARKLPRREVLLVEPDVIGDTRHIAIAGAPHDATGRHRVVSALADEALEVSLEGVQLIGEAPESRIERLVEIVAPMPGLVRVIAVGPASRADAGGRGPDAAPSVAELGGLRLKTVVAAQDSERAAEATADPCAVAASAADQAEAGRVDLFVAWLPGHSPGDPSEIEGSLAVAARDASGELRCASIARTDLAASLVVAEVGRESIGLELRDIAARPLAGSRAVRARRATPQKSDGWPTSETSRAARVSDGSSRAQADSATLDGDGWRGTQAGRERRASGGARGAR